MPGLSAATEVRSCAVFGLRCFRKLPWLCVGRTEGCLNFASLCPVDVYAARYRRSRVARNASWMFLGQGLRLIIQAAYFVIIARSLGTTEYGAFMAVVAVAGVLRSLAGLGSDKLLIKNVARNRELLDVYFGNGAAMTVGTGLAAVAILMGIARAVLPPSIPSIVVLMIAVSDIVCCRLIDLCASAFQSVEQLSRTAQITVLISAARLVGIAAAVAVWRRPTAELWSFAYFAATAIAAVVSLLYITALLRSFKLSPDRIRGELVEGFYFSVGLSAQTIYNDLDKTMLARFSTLDATGIYSAAYRIIDVAFTPVGSLLYAAYPGFFRQGSRIEGTYEYAKRLMPQSLGFSVAIFVAIILGAPVAPKILGRDYARIVEALRWLALLPVLKSMHYFLADALTGAGHQGLRTGIQVVVAGFNVLINIWLIPAYSWRGAAWSSLASDALLGALMWIAILTLGQRQASDSQTELSVCPEI